jgi:hypothetical protein
LLTSTSLPPAVPVSSGKLRTLVDLIGRVPDH